MRILLWLQTSIPSSSPKRRRLWWAGASSAAIAQQCSLRRGAHVLRLRCTPWRRVGCPTAKPLTAPPCSAVFGKHPAVAPTAAWKAQAQPLSCRSPASLVQRTVFMFADQAELDLPSDEEINATGADAPDSLAYKVGWEGCRFA